MHPLLVSTICLAAQRYWLSRGMDGSFVRVTEGVRSPERQRQLVKEGKSWTLESYHLTGHAVDVALFPKGKLTWDFDHYRDFSEFVYEAAGEFSTLITWGGEWKVRDGPHFQIETKQKF